MMQVKQPTSILERIQNVYQEYPPPFWVLMTGTFIDLLGTNLIIPFLAIYIVQRFEAKLTRVGLIYTLFAIGSGLGNFLAGVLQIDLEGGSRLSGVWSALRQLASPLDWRVTSQDFMSPRPAQVCLARSDGPHNLP